MNVISKIDKVSLPENTQSRGIQKENIINNSESSSLLNYATSSSFQEQKSRKKCKKVSEEKCQSVA